MTGVGLTHFPHGPSDNRREWPPQTPPRHPPFPVGRNIRWKRLYLTDFLFYFSILHVCCCVCEGHWLRRPLAQPPVVSEMSYLITQTHVNKHTQTKTQRKTLFPLTLLRSCGDVYTVVISRPSCSNPYPLKVYVHNLVSERVFMQTCDATRGSSWTLSEV